MTNERLYMDETTKPRDNCGIVGIIDFGGKQVVRRAVVLLNEVNHRGQDSGGLSIINAGYRQYKNLGTVNQIFTEDVLESQHLRGHVAIGHVRYKNQGGDTLAYTGPLRAEYNGRWLALSHNGNSKSDNLVLARMKLAAKGIFPEPDFDSNVLAHLIVSADGDNWIEKVQNGLVGIDGSYSLAIATDDSHLLAVRDPWGNRPVATAEIDDGVVIASERGAFTEIDCSNEYELNPGEILDFSKEGAFRSSLLERAEGGRCVFELIYLADETSIMDVGTVSSFRKILGQKLAINHPGSGEVITAIPDAAEVAADAYSYILGKPKERIVIKKKNRVKRSFMLGEIAKRKREVEKKFKFSPDISGIDVDMVDDSIVNGTTLGIMVENIKLRYPVGEIHARSTAPPIIRECDRGVTFLSVDGAFVALDPDTGGVRSNEEIAVELGVTSVDYLSLLELKEAVNEWGSRDSEYCFECFGGQRLGSASLKLERPRIEPFSFV